ncbi:MAG: hypothetical protein LH472_15145 [Pyrinomonadaceae bacterium]|nr:hypothetical protein [Pyrinomonadaceae bacterium]
MTAKEQNKLVGIFLMIHGGIQSLVMIFIALFYGVIGAGVFASAQRQEEQIIGAVLVAAIVFIIFFSLLFIIPQLVGGWKIYKEAPNARIWGIIGSIVACLSFPLGTAAGVFGLVFLFGEEGKRFYLGGNSYAPPSFPSPPPNNWQ